MKRVADKSKQSKPMFFFLQSSHKITPGYTTASYSDFLSSELRNTGRLLISQSISNGKLSAIFGEDSRYTPRPAIGWWDKGYMITACGARDSRFYCVMTRGAKGYEREKGQSWAIQSTWNEVKKYISEKWKEGMIITGICYSTGLKQYLVIMTESADGQSYHRGSEGMSEWMEEQYEKKRHPTIIFTDPTDQEDFVVMTTDKNRSGYRKLHITLKK